MTTVISDTQREMQVLSGLKFILSHFEDSKFVLPRFIGAGKWFGVVKNIWEAMSWYRRANFIDCRIGLYAICTDEYVKRVGGTAPVQLLVDQDEKDFKTIEFELAATSIYANFIQMLGAHPTQLWTGGGYHFLLPQDAVILENIEDFREFREPSWKFLQFEERLVSGGKADSVHYQNISSTTRVPGSFNSKYCIRDSIENIIDTPSESEVSIVKCWDGNKFDSKSLLVQYYNHLQAEKIKNICRQIREFRTRGRNKNIGISYPWIDRLLNTPIPEFRYYCTWKILVPYLVTIKGLSEVETHDIIIPWLDRCNSMSRLHFDPEQKLRYVLRQVTSP